VERLRLRYTTSEQTEKHRLELRYRRKESTETLQQLAGAVEKLTQLAYPSADIATRDILTRDGFIDALDDRHLQIDIRRQNPRSLDAALTLAMELDVLNRGPVRNKDGSRPRHLGAVSAVEDSQSASPTKSSTDPTRRQGGQQPGRGSSGGDNKEGAQDLSSKGKQQSSSSSSKPKMEQMLNRVMQRLDKLELDKKPSYR